MEEVPLEKPCDIPALGHFPREPISMGTTLIACEFDGGVVVGTDSRTSTGSFVASRVTDKITPINSHLVVCRSGSAADTQAIADIAKYNIELFGTMEDGPVTVYRSTQIFRRYLYDYREQLMASVIVAGWDAKEGGQMRALVLLFSLAVCPQLCTAYDWGDFHKFAVIFFSLLGTFVGLGAIFTVIYFACFKKFLNDFQEEVADTHRMHHPWPIGSARWYWQQWLRTQRSASGAGSAKFPPDTYKSSLGPAYLVDVAEKGPVTQTAFPVQRVDSRLHAPSLVVDRPTYWTPQGLYQPAGTSEQFEEYRLVREESFLSQKSGERPRFEHESRNEDRVVRTTTTTHAERTLRPSTII